MTAGKQITFGPFRLDEHNECLWHGERAITLRPKVFAVLRHLLQHPRQLVTKRQLLDAVWPATFVGDAVLKDSVRQLREALGDDAQSPQYIETAHRRGYRFIGQIKTGGEAPAGAGKGDGDAGSPSPTVRPGAGSFAERLTASPDVLGRDEVLRKIRGWMEAAKRGARQIVFVTGEPGIGKTTFVEAFLAEAGRGGEVRITRGQCLEQYGAGEAYLPVLEGFSRLGRASGGGQVIEVLRQHAPTWLAQIPSLVPPAERPELSQLLTGATRERMLREMAEAVEALTTETPLVLVLEDLHWSDYSTLDLISYLSRRPDPARLMLIGTYRPVELILNEHPLKAVKRELQAHGMCHEIPLEYLTAENIAEYLDARFPGHAFPPGLARMIHAQTEGNPLFMVNVVNFLVDGREIIERDNHWSLAKELVEIQLGVPENIRQLIEKQIERLSPAAQRILEGASVVGMECSTRAIAAGLNEDADAVEEQCEELVRRHQFLSPARLVELPDGSVTPRYQFIHVLYLEVPYGRIAAMRRSQIHFRIGECGEMVYGERVGEIAAELAMHFEQGRDWPRAVKYLLLAAENAAHRFAFHEAAALARRGLKAFAELQPESAARTEETRLHSLLDASLRHYQDTATE